MSIERSEITLSIQLKWILFADIMKTSNSKMMEENGIQTMNEIITLVYIPDSGSSISPMCGSFCALCHFYAIEMKYGGKKWLY